MSSRPPIAFSPSACAPSEISRKPTRSGWPSWTSPIAVLSNPAQRRAFDARRTVGARWRWDRDSPRNGNGNGHAYDAAARLAAGPLSERLAAGLHGESLGELTINFGRYAGWTLSEIAGSDPDYLQWLSRHSSGIRYRRAILRLLRDREDAKSTLHVQTTP